MRIMSSVHPTNSQLRVFAKISASATPKVAGEEVSKDVNVVAARNMLVRLGLITLNNGEAELTQQGSQVAQDENIIDQTGQLTQRGKALAYTNSSDQQDNDTTGQQPETGQLPPDGDQGLSLEGFTLLKELLR